MEERLAIGERPRQLEAALAHPAGATAGAVVCHPHPRYGGSMDNSLVVIVARALAGRGLATLRFNFGGVGASGGTCSDGPEEVEDVRAALAGLRARLPSGTPVVLVGYSFGAWVGLRAAGDDARVAGVVAVAPPLALLDWDFLGAVEAPIAIVVGDRDRFCPVVRAEAVAAAHRERVTLSTIPGADHFFAGREDDVAAAVLAALPASAGGRRP